MTPGHLLYRCRRCHDVARVATADTGEILRAPATITHRCDHGGIGVCEIVGADVGAVKGG